MGLLCPAGISLICPAGQVSRYVLVPWASVELPCFCCPLSKALLCPLWLVSHSCVLCLAWGMGTGEPSATMETLNTPLFCLLCMELFPPSMLLLSCSHNFCKQCLELILLCQYYTHVHGQFCCPVYRKVRGVLDPCTPEAANFFLVSTSGTLLHERSVDGWPAKGRQPGHLCWAGGKQASKAQWDQW